MGKIRSEEQRLRENANQRRWNKSHKDQCRLSYNEWYRKNKFMPLVRFQSGKDTAKASKRIWTITFEQYTALLEQGCHYCPNDLKHERGYSLDRIDNTKGYTFDNVLPCCGVCNETRNDNWTVEETEDMIRAGLTRRSQHEKSSI